MYIDPGSLMPLASALAALVGIVTMFWHRTVGFVRTSFRTISGKIHRLFASR